MSPEPVAEKQAEPRTEPITPEEQPRPEPVVDGGGPEQSEPLDDGGGEPDGLPPPEEVSDGLPPSDEEEDAGPVVDGVGPEVSVDTTKPETAKSPL
ncbi:MAG: hypothetical protein H6727_21105 [Myxococcales bacterium]|nr:hypothetical protein [Myxococcales bacterium]